jgi:hypothetical protein
MSNKTYRVFLEKLGGTSADNFVGTQGDLFFDPENPVLRVANGVPGGATVAAGGGGGEVSGNITISSTNSAINFVANSSGDGYGYSTIELRPDENATQDQYIIIDPTAPSHIHIRAGGTQDDSDADLFLGGEKTFVRVRDGSGVRMQRTSDVSIFTAEYNTPADFTSGTWFTESGNSFIEYTTSNTVLSNHIFELGDNPFNYVTIYYDGGSSSYTLNYGGSASDEGGGVFRVQVDAAPEGNTPVTFTTMYWELFQEQTNYAELTTGDFTVDVRDDIRITGRDTYSLRNWSNSAPITIITDYDDNDYTWRFNANAMLEIPGPIRFSDTSVQTGASISLADLKDLVANTSSYDDFKTAIAAL